MESPKTDVAITESNFSDTFLNKTVSTVRAQHNEHGQLNETAANKDSWTTRAEYQTDNFKDRPDDFEDGIGNTTNQNGTLGSLFYSPCRLIYKPSKKYDEIMTKLIQMEDNGDFLKFDRYSSNAVDCFANTDPDIVAAVTVEQARCMLYRGKFKHVKCLAKRGHELARHTSFPPMFHARALAVMSARCRNKNKFGSSNRCLEQAKQNLKSVYSYEELAHFYEYYGTYLAWFLGNLPHPDENVKKLALASFKKMSEVAQQDTRPRVRDKNRFYALILSARVLLDSNSLLGRRERTVSKDSIALAREYLEVIKKELWNSIPRCSQVQFRLVESDLYFRQGKFEEGRGLLLQCLDEARSLGYELQVPIITKV